MNDTFHCFACQREQDITQLKKTGTRGDGKPWALCVECSGPGRRPLAPSHYVSPTEGPKHASLAEGFAAAAEREQHRLDLHSEIAKRLKS